MLKRISVFIDGANFYHGLKTIDSRYSDIFFDFEKFVNEIAGKDKLMDIYYYNAPLKENFNKHVYWNQMKLFERLRRIKRLKLVLCKRQKRLDGEEKEYFIIKGDDIHLALDMLRDGCKDKYDKVILVSGDGDFVPLVKYVKEEGREVVSYSFEGSASRDLIKEFSKESIFFIDKKMVNRIFLRKKK